VLPQAGAIDVTSKQHQAAVMELTRLLAAYRDSEDLIQIGAYVKGRNRDVGRAIELMPRIRDYLCQDRFRRHLKPARRRWLIYWYRETADLEILYGGISISSRPVLSFRQRGEEKNGSSVCY
jgi:hypothetical protein